MMAKKGAVDLMLENSVMLQKTMVSLVENITKLNEQISNLLGLFEEAAKQFVKAEKTVEKEKGESEEGEDGLVNKLDKLLEQNKTIAEALTLLHQNVHEPSEGFKPRPLPEYRF